MSFTPFTKLSAEAQARAIQTRPTFHIEPVMFHRDGAPLAQSMGAYHLQLGAEHTVLRADALAEFLRHLEHASQKLQRWTKENV